MSAYSDLIISKSPRVYLRMGESSGSPQDSSGNGNHVTATIGSPVYSQTGALFGDADTAITVAAADYFTVPDVAGLDLADVFTLEVWVKRITTGGSTGYAMVSKGVGAYFIRINTSDQLELLRSSTASIVSSTITITDTTTWHHCVATKNGASVFLYIDGVDRTGTVTNSTATDTATALAIGADAPAPSNKDRDGVLDEVAVYPTALTAASVLENYNMGKFGPATAGPPSRPVMCWP